MAVYWIILAFAAAAGIPLCGMTKKKSEGRAAAYCIALCLVLIVISSIRLSVGYDYNLYASLFYSLNSLDFNELGELSREKGLLIPMKLLNISTEYYSRVFILFSLMIYPPLFNYIRRYSDNPFFSAAAFLGMGIFFNSLNFISQFVAAVVGAYALKYLEKGCYFRFGVLVIFAFSFHRSALLLLCSAAFVFIPWNKITLAVTVSASALLFAFSRKILEFVTQYIYTGYDINAPGELGKGLSPYYTVMFGILFIAAFCLRDRLDGSEKEISILLWCSYAAFFFELIGTRFGVVSRFAVLFFIPAVLILIPKIIIAVSDIVRNRFSDKGAVVASVIVLLILTVNYAALLDRNYNGVVPYKTVYSAEKG